MKQIRIDQFKAQNTKQDPHRLTPDVLQKAQNVTLKDGTVTAIEEDTVITSDIYLPNIVTGIPVASNYDTDYSGDRDTSLSTATDREMFAFQYVAARDFDDSDLITVGVPLSLSASADPLPVSIRAEIRADDSGDPGDGRIGTGADTVFYGDEGTTNWSVKFLHVSLDTGETMTEGETYWIGFSISDTTTTAPVSWVRDGSILGVGATLTRRTRVGDAAAWTTPSATDGAYAMIITSEVAPSTITESFLHFRTITFKDIPRQFIRSGADTKLTTTTKDYELAALTPFYYSTGGTTYGGFIRGTLSNEAYTFTTVDGTPTIKTGTQCLLGIYNGLVFLMTPKCKYVVPIGFSPRLLAVVSGTPTGILDTYHINRFDFTVFSDYIVMNDAANANSALPSYITRKGVGAPTNQNFKDTTIDATTTVPNDPTFVGVQNETLVFWGSAGNPSRIYYGTRAEIDSFDSFTNISLGDPITAIIEYRDETYIFFNDEIHQYSGTPSANGFIFKKIASFGVQNRNHCVSSGSDIYMLNSDGKIVTFNGSFSEIQDVAEVTDYDTYSPRLDDSIVYDPFHREVLIKTNISDTVFYAYDEETRDTTERTEPSNIMVPFIGLGVPYILSASDPNGSSPEGSKFVNRRGSISKKRAYIIESAEFTIDPGNIDNVYQDLILITQSNTLNLGTDVLATFDKGTVSLTSVSESGQQASTARNRLNTKSYFMKFKLSGASHLATNAFKLYGVIITAQVGGRK